MVFDIFVVILIIVLKKLVNYVLVFLEYEKFCGFDFKDFVNGCGLCRVLIVWFRNDLCVYDNEVLVLVNRDFFFILLVYCFDLKDYGKLFLGFDKIGFYWVNFFLECVVNL